jgi:hypothetical protein
MVGVLICIEIRSVEPSSTLGNILSFEWQLCRVRWFLRQSLLVSVEEFVGFCVKVRLFLRQSASYRCMSSSIRLSAR